LAFTNYHIIKSSKKYFLKTLIQDLSFVTNLTACEKLLCDVSSLRFHYSSVKKSHKGHANFQTMQLRLTHLPPSHGQLTVDLLLRNHEQGLFHLFVQENVTF
jgi:hypothetical protein